MEIEDTPSNSTVELEVRYPEKKNLPAQAEEWKVSIKAPALSRHHEHKGVHVKVPVVLAELTLQISIDTAIALPTPAIEIKRVQKRLKLTQCLLLQDTSKLFVKGFVRKNIEFAALAGITSPTQIAGTIQTTTIDIPFMITTPVTFNLAPPALLNFNKTQNFEYIRSQSLPPDFPTKDLLMSGDLTEFNQISTEFFNELPFCELVSSRIVEFDEYLNRTSVGGSAPFEEETFTQIEEKMVVFLTLKILQKQQVFIPQRRHPKEGNEKCPEDQDSKEGQGNSPKEDYKNSPKEGQIDMPKNNCPKGSRLKRLRKYLQTCIDDPRA